MLVRIKSFPIAARATRELFDFERDIQDLFEDFVGSSLPQQRQHPPVDVAEEANETVLVAEMPGVRKEDVKISIHNGFLTISGVRAQNPLPENAKWVRNEIRTGEFSRTIELPYPVDPNHVTAEMSNGVLRITLPKPEEVRPREIRIK